MDDTQSQTDRPAKPTTCQYCGLGYSLHRGSCPSLSIAAVMRSAMTRPLAMTEPAYSNALGELAAMLADCLNHRSADYDTAWRDVLDVWQGRHIDAATEGQR